MLDAASLTKCTHISELSLDGNPLAKLPLYKEFWLEKFRLLRVFDGKRVTDEDKRLAVGFVGFVLFFLCKL